MDAWVDFSVARGSAVTTHRKYVRDYVTVGDTVKVGDFDGRSCEATVAKIVRNKVALELDLSTFHRVEEAA